MSTSSMKAFQDIHLEKGLLMPGAKMKIQFPGSFQKNNSDL